MTLPNTVVPTKDYNWLKNHHAYLLDRCRELHRDIVFENDRYREEKKRARRAENWAILFMVLFFAILVAVIVVFIP